MTLSYVLQIVTIAITLGLGLIAAYQNKKLQHGQNKKGDQGQRYFFGILD